jgi:hypothetical protein
MSRRLMLHPRSNRRRPPLDHGISVDLGRTDRKARAAQEAVAAADRFLDRLDAMADGGDHGR